MTLAIVLAAMAHPGRTYFNHRRARDMASAGGTPRARRMTSEAFLWYRDDWIRPLQGGRRGAAGRREGMTDTTQLLFGRGALSPKKPPQPRTVSRSHGRPDGRHGTG